MREPAFHMPDGGRVPFSQAPIDWLRDVISRDLKPLTSEDLSGPADADFASRYAAILLNERGL